MPLGDYLVGLLYLVGTWGATAYTAWRLEQVRLPRMDRAARTLALGVLFLAALIAAHLVAGMLGLLSREVVTAVALLGALAAWRTPRGAVAARPSQPLPADRGTGVSRAVAAIAVVAVCAFVLAALQKVRPDAITHIDAMSFSLPGVARWIQSGSIWEVGSFLPLIQVRTYPNNGDVLALAAILPWSNDAFLRLLAPPLLGMTGLGVYAIGRELRAPGPLAALLGAAVVSAQVVAGPALYELKPDAFMYATFATGVAFLLRHRRTRAGADLALAGLGLGLALGSRWYGLTAVFLVFAAWVLAALIARRPLRDQLRDTLLLAGIVLAAGGFWLLRNLALTGNPLYPVRAELLGVALLDAPRDVITERFGFTVFDRLGEPGFVRHELLPAYRHALGGPGLVVVVGALLAVAQIVRLRRRDAHLGSVILVVAAAAVVAISYAFLPGSAQGTADGATAGILEGTARWLVPALLLGAPVAAWAAGRLPRPARTVAEVAALACVLVAIPGTFTVTAAGLAAAVALGLLAWVVVALLARAPGERPWRRSRAVAVALVAAVAILAVVGHLHQRAYNDSRYAALSGPVDWVEAFAEDDAKVGVAGYWSTGVFVPIYALAGKRLDHEVEYVGRLVSSQVRPFHEPAGFREALERGAYDLLAVGRLEAPDLTDPRPQATLDDPPEVRWARGAGFTEVARDNAFVLLARDRR